MHIGCVALKQTQLLRCFVTDVFIGIPLALADFVSAGGQQPHDFVFLIIGQALPIQPLFPAAQAAFAIAFAVGLANADAGAGNVEKVGLFHDGRLDEIEASSSY